jgi:endonuclease/exonuclease/phosphatase family metal-dependent hydrolase
MRISVLQWNIWFKEDIENIARVLNDNKADVICLQELTRGYQEPHTDTIKYIAGELGYNFHFEEMHSEEQPWTQANAIFSKFPIVDRRTVMINEPTGTGHYDDEYRAYVEVTVDVDGQNITVGTAHMSYTNRFENTERKENEARKLIDILKQMKSRYIFTGDLNAAPESNTVTSVRNMLKWIGGDQPYLTWTTKPFSYDGFEETDLKWCLDYIFSTDDISEVSFNTIKTDFSDHLPVTSLLDIG